MDNGTEKPTRTVERFQGLAQQEGVREKLFNAQRQSQMKPTLWDESKKQELQMHINDEPGFLDALDKTLDEWKQAVEYGYEGSIPGMMIEKEAPSLKERHQSFMAEVIQDTTTGLLEAPVYALGGLLGVAGGSTTGPGALATGTAGALALPAGMRKVITTNLRNGDIYKEDGSWDMEKLWGRIWDSSKETLKNYIGGYFGSKVGGAVAGAGSKFVVDRFGNKVKQEVAERILQLPTEALAITAFSNLMNGQMPNEWRTKDFVHSLVGVGVGHYQHKYLERPAAKGVIKTVDKYHEVYSEKYMKVFEETGVPPKELMKMSEKNPKIREEMLDLMSDMPEYYEKLSKKASGGEDPNFNPNDISEFPDNPNVKTYTPIPNDPWYAKNEYGEQVHISKMTRAEYDKAYVGNKMSDHKERVKDYIAKVVTEETGTSDFNEIVAFYKKKHHIKNDIKFRFEDDLLETQGAYGYASWSNKGEAHRNPDLIMKEQGIPFEIVVDSRLKGSPEFSKEMGIATLRHELEHVIEYSERYINQRGAEPVPRLEGETLSDYMRRIHGHIKDPEGDGNVVEPGMQQHHKDYEYFESDFVHKFAIREALEKGGGDAVDLNVVKDYPDLAQQYKTNYTPDTNMDQKISHGDIKKKTHKANIKDAFTDHLIDDLGGLARAVDDGVGKKGAHLYLPADQNPYKMARLARGHGGKLKHMLEHNMYNMVTGKDTGKSYKEILKSVRGRERELSRYAVAKRCEELHNRGKETGFEGFNWREEIAKGDADEVLHTAHKDLMGFTSAMLTQMRDAGFYSEKEYQRMLTKNRQYVPFKRLMDDTIKKYDGYNATSGELSKAYKGSQRPVIDPLEQIVRDLSSQVQAIEQNTVIKHFRDFVVSQGRTDLMERVKRKDNTLSDTVESIAHREGILPSEVRAEDFMKGETKDTVVLWEDGKPQAYKVSPDVKSALSLLTDTDAMMGADNPIGKVGQWVVKTPTRTLRAGATLNPGFMLTNFVRDQASAFVYGKDGAGYIPVVDFVNGMASSFFKDKHYQAWLKSGGAMSEFTAMDQPHLQREIYENLTGRRVRNLMKHPLDILRALSQLSERGTRVGEYKRQKNRIGSTDAQAGFESRDITIDFSKAGKYTRVLNQISAFSNAKVQGHAKLVNAFREKPIETTARIAFGITGVSIGLALLNKDDEKIQSLPQWQRDLFWCFNIDGVIYRLPKPHEVGIVFGSVFERMVDNDPHAWDNVGETFKRAMGFDRTAFMPDLATPFIEYDSNYSYFKDTTLIPAGLENVLPEFQYTTSTTAPAKAVAKALRPIFNDVNGLHVENFVTQWTGGLGRIAMGAIDGFVPREQPRPDFGLRDNLIIKSFMARHPSANMRHLNLFRKRHEKATVQDTTVKHLAKSMMFGDYRDLVSKAEWIKVVKYKETISEMATLIRMITNLPSGFDNKTDEELKQWKGQQIDALYIQMNKIGEEGLRVYDRIDEQLEDIKRNEGGDNSLFF
jgi:hypothetical protein